MGGRRGGGKANACLLWALEAADRGESVTIIYRDEATAQAALAAHPEIEGRVQQWWPTTSPRDGSSQ